MTGAVQSFGLSGARSVSDQQDDVALDSSAVDAADASVLFVLRERRFGGALMFDVLRAFGAAGGVDAVLERIERDGRSLSVAVLQVRVQLCVSG
jgi:hypothetical protein